MGFAAFGVEVDPRTQAPGGRRYADACHYRLGIPAFCLLAKPSNHQLEILTVRQFNLRMTILGAHHATGT